MNWERAMIGSLSAAYAKVEELGDDGKQSTGDVNEFGQNTFVADIEAGRAVFDYLRTANAALIAVSEEHGKKVHIGKKPSGLAVIDELDGSKPYKERTGRHGTMLAVFSSLNPKYDDYLACGIVDQVHGLIYVATPEKGAFIYHIAAGQRTAIPHLQNAHLDPKDARIVTNGWFNESVIMAENLVASGLKNVRIGTPEDGHSSSASYVDVATGVTSVYIEPTFKRNLEKAVAYGLIKEVGGAMVDIEGNSLGEKLYLEFGQEPEDRFPIISAATPQLAAVLINALNTN